MAMAMDSNITQSVMNQATETMLNLTRKTRRMITPTLISTGTNKSVAAAQDASTSSSTQKPTSPLSDPFSTEISNQPFSPTSSRSILTSKKSMEKITKPKSVLSTIAKMIQNHYNPSHEEWEQPLTTTEYEVLLHLVRRLNWQAWKSEQLETLSTSDKMSLSWANTNMLTWTLSGSSTSTLKEFSTCKVHPRLEKLNGLFTNSETRYSFVPLTASRNSDPVSTTASSSTTCSLARAAESCVSSLLTLKKTAESLLDTTMPSSRSKRARSSQATSPSRKSSRKTQQTQSATASVTSYESTNPPSDEQKLQELSEHPTQDTSTSTTVPLTLSLQIPTSRPSSPQHNDEELTLKWQNPFSLETLSTPPTITSQDLNSPGVN